MKTIFILLRILLGILVGCDDTGEVNALVLSSSKCRFIAELTRLHAVKSRSVERLFSCRRSNFKSTHFRADRTRCIQLFLADDKGTKHDLAEILAKRFSEELGSRLPPKRLPWMSEDYRMDIFDAVALALAIRKQKD